MKRVDKEIKKRVQSVRLEVPQRIEKQFLTELAASQPLESKRPKSRVRYWPVLVVAASLILIVGWLFIGKQFFQNQSGNDTAKQQVFIRSVQINGKPAKTYYFQSKDKNKLIVWTQKIS